MLRLEIGTLIVALLVAPLGFGGATSGLFSDMARVVFAMLAVAFVAFAIAGAMWSRRWTV